MGREIEHEEYDQFRAMLRSVGRYSENYRSFSNNKEYRNLLGETASGLILDVAARTGELSPENRERHYYSLEVFAALCMYFCVQQLQMRRNASVDLIQDTATSIYGKILRYVRANVENGDYVSLRGLIGRFAGFRLAEQMDKVNKWEPIEEEPEKEKDDWTKRLSSSIAKRLLDGTAELMEKEKRRVLLESAIVKAAERGVLSKEDVIIICCFYGFGDGFKKMKNQDLAKKLNLADSAVTQRRKRAIQRLHDFILKDPELREGLVL